VPLISVNNHQMYYEIHGTGEPVICSGGWGTFAMVMLATCRVVWSIVIK
jgi:hypothetical protein